MGLIADIVPNHMAADVSNPWWADVLRYGERSPHSRCFDIDWRAPDPALRGKVLLPVLPDPYGECLDAGAIVLAHDRAQGYTIVVGGQRYPLAEAPLPVQSPARTCAAHAPDTMPGRRRLHQLLERQHYRLAWWRTAPDQINWRRFFEIHELVGVRVEDDVVFDAVHALPLRLYREGCSTGCASTTSTAWPRPAPTCAGCARRWPRRRRRARRPAWPPNPIWSWKRSWPMTSASTRAGPPTAPPAMTSWTTSARCCTRPPRVNRWRNSGRP
ncbi:hypothetical protein WJ978_29525 [Achromobacter xylosoxidans]